MQRKQVQGADFDNRRCRYMSVYRPPAGPWLSMRIIEVAHPLTVTIPRHPRKQAAAARRPGRPPQESRAAVVRPLAPTFCPGAGQPGRQCAPAPRRDARVVGSPGDLPACLRERICRGRCARHRLAGEGPAAGQHRRRSWRGGRWSSTIDTQILFDVQAAIGDDQQTGEHKVSPLIAAMAVGTPLGHGFNGEHPECQICPERKNEALPPPGVKPEGQS